MRILRIVVEARVSVGFDHLDESTLRGEVSSLVKSYGVEEVRATLTLHPDTISGECPDCRPGTRCGRCGVRSGT